MLRITLLACAAILAASTAWADCGHCQGDKNHDMHGMAASEAHDNCLALASSNWAPPAGPAIADLLKTIDAHSGAVNAMALSSDGGSVITGGKDGHVRVWDAESGELIADVPACQVAINDIAVDPNGVFFVTAAEDGFIKVWDAISTDLIVALPAHLGDSADNSGSVGRYNETIRSAHGTTNRYMADRVPSVLSAMTVAVSPDGAYVYSGGDDGFIRCYSVEEDYALLFENFAGEIGNAGSNAVTEIILNGDGTTLFAGSSDGKVNIYNAVTGEFESQVQAYEQGSVSCLALNNNEMCLISGGTNGEVRVWDAFTGSLVKTIRAHAGGVNHVAFSADDKYVLSGGEDGKIKLWNHASEKAGEAQAHVLGLRNFVVSGSTIATGGADFKVRVWHANF
jgi:WD40 repeat protein